MDNDKRTLPAIKLHRKDFAILIDEAHRRGLVRAGDSESQAAGRVINEVLIPLLLIEHMEAIEGLRRETFPADNVGDLRHSRTDVYDSDGD